MGSSPTSPGRMGLTNGTLMMGRRIANCELRSARCEMRDAGCEVRNTTHRLYLSHLAPRTSHLISPSPIASAADVDDVLVAFPGTDTQQLVQRAALGA